MFATGVTVITTLKGEQVHGMTANAFMSVSLEPPLVLISVDRRTKMCGMLHEGNRYGVSVLCETQARSPTASPAGPARTAPPPASTSSTETPLVDGALAHFVARVERSYWGGDHSLFLGRVEYARHHAGHAAAVPRRALRQRRATRPARSSRAARLLPQHREERLVHREVAAAAVARVGLVHVGRVEAGVGRDQVGDDRAAVA